MSLVDEARAMQRRTGSPCLLRRIQADNPPLYGEIVDALGSDVSCSAIARALANRKLPIPVSRDMLERHRRGDCTWCR